MMTNVESAWQPQVGPQLSAICSGESGITELFFGGAAGGGKVKIGLAFCFVGIQLIWMS